MNINHIWYRCQQGRFTYPNMHGDNGISGRSGYPAFCREPPLYLPYISQKSYRTLKIDTHLSPEVISGKFSKLTSPNTRVGVKSETPGHMSFYRNFVTSTAPVGNFSGRPISRALPSAFLDNINSVDDLVRYLYTVSDLSSSERKLLELIAVKILPNDLREMSVLLLTLNSFGCNIDGLMNGINYKGRDMDILFRALAECGKGADIANDILADGGELTINSSLNYLCGYSTFIKKGLLNLDSNILLKYCDYLKEDNRLEKLTKKQSMDLCIHLSIFQSFGEIIDKVLENVSNKLNLNETIHLIHHTISNHRNDKLFKKLLSLLTNHYSSQTTKNTHQSIPAKRKSLPYVSPCPAGSSSSIPAERDSSRRLVTDNSYAISGSIDHVEGIKDKPGGKQSGERSDVFHMSSLVSALVIFGKVYGEGVPVELLDSMMIDLRKGVHELSLKDISQVIVSLSKLSYNNRAIVSLLSRSVFTFIDEDSILEPQIITNLLLGFSRFKPQDPKLFKFLGHIILKEEVLAELKTHDAVTVIQAFAKAHTTNEALFKALIQLISKNRNLNTELAVKVVNALSKLNYQHIKKHNHIIETINPSEITNPVELEVSNEKLYCVGYLQVADAEHPQEEMVTTQPLYHRFIITITAFKSVYGSFGCVLSRVIRSYG